MLQTFLRNVFREASPFTKLLFAGFIIFSCFILLTFLGIILAIPIFGISFSELTNVATLQDYTNINIIIYIQIIQSTALFVIPPFLIAAIYDENLFGYLQCDKKPRLFSVILSGIAIIASLPLINILVELNSALELPSSLSWLEEKMIKAEEDAQYITELFLRRKTISALIINILMIAVIPALGEELLFRGIIQRLLSEWMRNAHIGIIISAILFSAFHFQFFGFLPRMLLGIFFGYLLLWSKSIWLPIAAHFINNAATIMVYFLFSDTFIEQEVNHLGLNKETVIHALVSLFAVSVIILTIYNYEKKRNKTNASLK